VARTHRHRRCSVRIVECDGLIVVHPSFRDISRIDAWIPEILPMFNLWQTNKWLIDFIMDQHNVSKLRTYAVVAHDKGVLISEWHFSRVFGLRDARRAHFRLLNMDHSEALISKAFYSKQHPRKSYKHRCAHKYGNNFRTDAPKGSSERLGIEGNSLAEAEIFSLMEDSVELRAQKLLNARRTAPIR